jgi:hypothetical protein
MFSFLDTEDHEGEAGNECFERSWQSDFFCYRANEELTGIEQKKKNTFIEHFLLHREGEGRPEFGWQERTRHLSIVVIADG